MPKMHFGEKQRGTAIDTNALKERLTIQKLTADGTWSKVHDTWGAVEDLGVPGYQVPDSRPTHTITVRYISGVTTSMRFLWGARELYIVERQNMMARNQWISCDCSESRIASWVEENGKTVSFSTFESDTYSPSTGEITKGTETVHSVKVAGPETITGQEVNSDLVQSGDATINVPEEQVSFVPYNNQKVSIDGEAWHIVRVEKKYIGEFVDSYMVQIRQ